MAERLGLVVEWVQTDWRRNIDPSVVRDRLAADANRAIRAVAIVHNETSTGVTNPIDEVRAAIDDANHPALLMVDAVSSLASIDFCHDDWGIDVTVAGSQKGLMLPPGLSFNAISEKARKQSERVNLPSAYWRWDDILDFNQDGFFPYTPATNLLFGLREALTMLEEEGLQGVFARHQRHAEATRCAVKVWGLEPFCQVPEAMSNSVTAVVFPDGHDANAFRSLVREQFNMSLGGGLGPLKGKVIRIGHLGDLNDLMLAATLSGVEMALARATIPHTEGGVQAALSFLAASETA